MDGAATIGLKENSLSIESYSPTWASAFEIERKRVLDVTANLSARIEHIGSTAVPGLDAKPIVDIGVEVRAADLEDLLVTLVGMGYIYRGIRSGRLLIRLRDGDVRTHNLHVYEQGDADLEDQIRFRDALRCDTALRDRYAALKHDIARSLGGARSGYAEMKTAFVREFA